MILLVDAGNTRIKWAQLREGGISGHGAALHAAKPVNDVLMQAWAVLPRPERIVVANVAGESMAAKLSAYAREHFKLAPEFVIPTSQAGGVTNGYRNPAQLGADRWAGMLAARRRGLGPVCVIGCGTAITLDTLTRDGRHLGGLIAPGIGVMHRALSQAATAIVFEPDARVTLYANDTGSATTSGIVYAVAGCIERAAAQIRAQQGDETEFLLTGGDAEGLQPQLQGRFTLAPHLVLEGLAVLAERQA
ncbi:MAG: type III pantothenate kinase [Gammaproteobacteria bacterium]